MKTNTVRLVACACILLLSACGKDDDDATPNTQQPAELVGTWAYRWSAVDSNGNNTPDATERMYMDTTITNDMLYLHFYSNGVLISEYTGHAQGTDTIQWAVTAPGQIRLTSDGTSGTNAYWIEQGTDFILRHTPTADPDDADWSCYRKQ